MILYLHGFRSSPHSFKARLMAQHMAAAGRAAEFFCPQLPPSPRQSVALAEQIMADNAPADITLVGSSLGGYYACWLAEQSGCKAVLLNPAVQPPHDLERYVGTSTWYHSGEPFEFKAGYVDELRAYAIGAISRPGRYFLLAATGDEVLDWRDMVAHYPGARQRIIAGSDHGMGDFAAYLPEVMAFCDDRSV